MPRVFTEDERADWIKFCKDVEDDFEIARKDYDGMTDAELDSVSDWYFELTMK